MLQSTCRHGHVPSCERAWRHPGGRVSALYVWTCARTHGCVCVCVLSFCAALCAAFRAAVQQRVLVGPCAAEVRPPWTPVAGLPAGSRRQRSPPGNSRCCRCGGGVPGHPYVQIVTHTLVRGERWLGTAAEGVSQTCAGAVAHAQGGAPLSRSTGMLQIEHTHTRALLSRTGTQAPLLPPHPTLPCAWQESVSVSDQRAARA